MEAPDQFLEPQKEVVGSSTVISYECNTYVPVIHVVAIRRSTG